MPPNLKQGETDQALSLHGISSEPSRAGTLRHQAHDSVE